MREDETIWEACAIPEEDQDDAREGWRHLVDAVEDVKELDDGFEFRLPASSDWLREAGRLLAGERECCPFLRYELVSEADGGPIRMRFRSEDAMRKGLKEEVERLFS